MKQLKQANHVILILLTIFLTFTAFLGGVGILMDWTPLSVADLEGSIFTSYTIPALALALIVGGGALIASVMLIRKNKYAKLTSITAGMIIMIFEFVEVIIVGSPPGIARNLQLFYFGLGVVIILVSLLIWFVEIAISQTPMSPLEVN